MTQAYVTGATGTIGMALIGELLKNEIKTTVFLRKSSPRSAQLAEWFAAAVDGGSLRLEYVSLDALADYIASGEKSDFCQPGDSRTSVFYHLGWGGTFGAGRNDEALQQRNVKYTLDAVRLAKRLGCTHFIGAGSQAEYGRAEEELTPQTKEAPENEYGRAKLLAGIKSRQLCIELGIRHSWVRVLSVYGSFDGKNTMIMSAIRNLMAGRRVSLTKGEQVWNYLYSEDAARAFYMLGCTDDKKDNAKKSAVYCLAGDSACSLKEYILKLCHAVGADESLLGFGDIPYSDRQVMYLTADIKELTDDTGFVPVTAFDDGIKKTADWVKKFGIPMYGYGD